MPAVSSRKARMRSLPPPEASTLGLPSCNSRTSEQLPLWGERRKLWPPTHLVNRRAGAWIDVLSRFHEAVLLIKTHRAHIVLIDVKLKQRRRQTTRLRKQHVGDTAALAIGRDHDLVEISGRWIDHHRPENASAAEYDE